MTSIESIPKAGMLLKSLKSVGYSEEAAIADIVDNAISAKATEIKIQFDYENQKILVLDNGMGMSQEDLYENMRIGSADPNAERKSNDLGRFGMGMKTAAFSLGECFTVVTKSSGTISNASWDLTKVDEIGWQILVDDTHVADSYLDQYLEHGTAIIITKLDFFAPSKKNTKKDFYKIVTRVREQLGMIFHRFINEDHLKIYVNDMLLEAWDPFITDNLATQELDIVSVLNPDKKTLTEIRPYILPHKTKYKNDIEYSKAGGPKGWSRHQGIYLYRNRRLIVYGSWFGLLVKQPVYNLARIRIDIGTDVDDDWQIDIKKSHASLPAYVRDVLEPIVNICANKSQRVFNARGSYVKRNDLSDDLSFVWEQVRINGRNYFRLNKKHPLLEKIMSLFFASRK